MYFSAQVYEYEPCSCFQRYVPHILHILGRDQDKFQELIWRRWPSYTRWYCKLKLLYCIKLSKIIILEFYDNFYIWSINVYLPLFVNLKFITLLVFLRWMQSCFSDFYKTMSIVILMIILIRDRIRYLENNSFEFK